LLGQQAVTVDDGGGEVDQLKQMLGVGVIRGRPHRLILMVEVSSVGVDPGNAVAWAGAESSPILTSTRQAIVGRALTTINHADSGWTARALQPTDRRR
jgi:hypothetical protein